MKKKVFCLVVAVLCICNLTGCWESSYWDGKVRQFQEENGAFRKGQIVFIGDSITDGYDLNRHFSSYGIPLELYNRGINGDTTSGLLNRLDVSLFDIQPSKIVILIGINDLNGGKSTAHVLDNYDEILKQIAANLPSTKVYVQSIYPIDNTSDTIGERISQIMTVNDELQALAQTYVYTYVDIFSHLKTAENRLIASFSNDGLHLNDEGYQVVTSQIAPYLLA